MAFPVPEDVTVSGPGAATTSHVYALPPVVNDFDRLLLSATVGHDSAASAGLGSWTQIADDTRHTFDRRMVYEVRAVPSSPGAGEALTSALQGGTVTVTTSSSVRSSCAVVRTSGAAAGGNGTGFAAAVGAWGAAQGTAPDPPSLAPAFSPADVLFLTVVCHDAGAPAATATPPTGHTEIADTGGVSGVGQGVAVSELESASASEDPGAWTLSKTSWHSSVTFAYAPAATVATGAADLSASFALTASGTTHLYGSADLSASFSLLARGSRPVAAFPAARLGVKVEIEPGGTWTDLSERLVSATSDLAIPVTRGRADESADPQPATATTLLDNTDGELTPGDARSQFWPHLRQGLPVRVSAEAAGPALVLGGAGWAGTPDHPDFDVTDLDIRMRIDPDAWAVSAAPDSTPFRLVTKWAAPGDISWMFSLLDLGRLEAAWSADGTAAGIDTATTQFLTARQRPLWVAVTLLASANLARFWVWDPPDGAPPDDIEQWALLDEIDDDTPPSATISAGAANVEIGARNAGLASFQGRVLAVEIRDAVNGTVIADPDFTLAVPGDTIVLDSTGKTWTLHGDAAISTYRARFAGSADEIAPTWPYRDTNPGAEAGTYDDIGTVRPSEARTMIVAAGPLRRLAQADPLESALRRHITRTDGVLGYWPCEEPSAVSQGSGLPGGQPLALSGTTGDDGTLDASAPLPSIEEDAVYSWSARPAADPSGTGWQVEQFYRLDEGETSPARTTLFQVATSTGLSWRLAVSATDLHFLVSDESGTLIDSTVGLGDDVAGRWVRALLAVTQDGPDADWAWTLTPVDRGTGGGVASTLASASAGYVSSVSAGGAGPPGGISFGHVVTSDGTLGGNWLLGPDSAWVGESAAHRIWRLCNEESVPVEVWGDKGVFFDDYGDLAVTDPMGPQRRANLVELLTECQRVDGGVLGERRAVSGLTYRCRHTLENQAPAMVLDAAEGDIAPPFEPTLDDQRLLNDATVTCAGGNSARYSDDAHIDVHGRYDEGAEIAGAGGLVVPTAVLADQPGLAQSVQSQSLMMAGWLVHAGTWGDMRYPVAALDFRQMTDDRAAAQLAAYHHLVPGDRVTVTGLPVQHPASTVELLVEQVAETLTPVDWVVGLACSPGGLWLLGALDDGEGGAGVAGTGHIASDGAALGAAITATDTSILLDTSGDAAPWTTDSADYPLLVVLDDAELVLAAGATTTTDVVLTGCTRSVNGVESGHAMGATTEVASPWTLA